MTRLRLDHIVVGASTLAEGRRWLESKLGLAPAGGGKHPVMGTHNALWRLDCCYLEVIAADPEASNPARPRIFGLDNPVTQARLRTRPRLLTWVAATNGIGLDLASAPLPLGQPLAMKRDHLAWQILVPKDGSLPAEGAFPTLIEWDRTSASPAKSLPEQGLRLERLTVAVSADRARWLTARGIGAPVEFAAGSGLSASISNVASGVSLVLD